MFFKMNFIYFVICSCFYFIMSKIASTRTLPCGNSRSIAVWYGLEPFPLFRRRPAFKHQSSFSFFSASAARLPHSHPWNLPWFYKPSSSPVSFPITHHSWRITDSNRWPPACKAGALASWANPPRVHASFFQSGCKGRHFLSNLQIKNEVFFLR